MDRVTRPGTAEGRRSKGYTNGATLRARRGRVKPVTLALLAAATLLLAPPLAAQMTVVWQEDFERPNVTEDWIPDNAVWQVGMPIVGPGGAYSGANVLCTGLSGNSPGVSSTVASPFITVPEAAQNPRLRFHHYFEFRSFSGVSAYGQVRIRKAGGAWENLSSQFTGHSSRVWTYAAPLDLTAYAGEKVQLGFYFECPYGGVGWFIDDAKILTGPPPVFTNPEDFEGVSVQENWTADHAVWQLGTPVVGPGAAYSGTNVLCTGLIGNSELVSSTVASPFFTVPDASKSPRVRFRQYYDFRNFAGVSAFGQVRIRSAGGAWENISDPYTGHSSGAWTYSAPIDLTAYAGRDVQLGFYFECPHGGVGWFIDDVRIVTGPPPTFRNPETFEDASAPEDWIADHAVWQVGTPVVGPGAAYSGTNVLCTGLAGNRENVSSTVASASFTMPDAWQNPRLRFYHYYEFRDFSGVSAFGQVRIRVAGGPWEDLGGKFTGHSSGAWVYSAPIDLTAYAGKEVQLGFYFECPHGGVGWFIDDVKILTDGFVNRPPVLAAIPSAALVQGQTLTFTAAATDPDTGQVLTYSLGSDAPAGATIDPTTGVFSWTPTESQCWNSYHRFSVTVADSATPALSASQNVAVKIAGGLRLAIERQGGFVTVRLTGGEAGRDYLLQASEDLKEWTDVVRFIKPGESFAFMDPTQLALDFRFFRILAP